MNPHPTKKELTHQRIVGVAARAIRRSGFDGVGVADVMKEAGLTHGGFYAHFASREAMLAEAMVQAGRDSADNLSHGAEARQARGVSALRALIEGYLSDGHLSRIESGCAVAALLSEMPRQSVALRDAAAARVLALVEAVRQALPAPHAKDDALVIASTLVGALQLARALGANAKGRAVLAAARASLIAAHDAA
ncbi:MAG: TetR/AcrR family transcriptional regulator [Burkholderiales bacterium]|nr:TetR/AcrR family transcriptional regulator [Burkholderiales bacterium]